MSGRMMMWASVIYVSLWEVAPLFFLPRYIAPDFSALLFPIWMILVALFLQLEIPEPPK